MTYDPQAKLKESTKIQLRSQFNADVLTEALSVDIVFTMPIPASSSKKKKEQMKDQCHKVRPDIDNLLKYVFDCLNEVVISDDSIISFVSAKKIYGEPGTTINISTIEQI